MASRLGSRWRTGALTDRERAYDGLLLLLRLFGDESTPWQPSQDDDVDDEPPPPLDDEDDVEEEEDDDDDKNLDNV